MSKLTRVAIEEEETFEDLKSRLAIFGKHIDGFYRLLKVRFIRILSRSLWLVQF
jgi:hypothetical protein